MTIGQAYSDILSAYEQKALDIACNLLIDHAFEDVKQIKKSEDVPETWLEMYLPQRYMCKYTPLFFKQFTVCLVTVTWKLAQVEKMRPASVAEELAAWIIVQEARRILQDDLEEAAAEDNLETFIDLFFEDLDIEYLFDNAYDGIDENYIGQILGMTSLAFKNWFKPFSNEPDQIIHPYVED